MLDLVLKGLWETIYMTVGATVLAYIVGLPLGLVLAALRGNGRAIARHHVALIVVDGDGNVLLSQRKRAGQQGENQKKR